MGAGPGVLVEGRVEALGQGGFAVAFVGQRPVRDGVAAGGPFAAGVEQGVEGAAVRGAWEQLVAVDQVA